MQTWNFLMQSLDGAWTGRACETSLLDLSLKNSCCQSKANRVSCITVQEYMTRWVREV